MNNPSNPAEVHGSPGPPVRCRHIDECYAIPIAAVEGSMHVLRHVNPAFCTLVGKNKEDLLGKPFAEAVPEAERWLSSAERVYLTAGEAGAQTEREGGESRPLYWLFSQWPDEAAERPAGVVLEVKGEPDVDRQATAMTQALMLTAVRYHALKDEADRLNAQLSAENDERKLVEERLRASLQDIRNLQAAIDEHSIVTISDIHGRITYTNDKFCALSKFSREDLLGRDHRIVSSGFHPREFIRELWKTIGEGGVWHGEVKDRAKDGTFFWLETTIVPCVDTQGTPFQYVAIRTDITARKESEIALGEAQRNAEKANHAKDEFIAALSHELRTPLTPVLMMATSMAADEQLEPALRAQMELIRQNVTMEAQLIDDLLDVTKIERGKITLQPEAVDLHQLLLSALETVGEDLSRKRIVVQLHANARFFRTKADPTRIQQVFWNLIKNAAKFTQEGGRIDIRTFNANDRSLSLEIRDNGVGIAPENLPTLFAPFEQGAATGNPRFGGLGLGLTISKAIVELHGGTIDATSDGVGQGAIFTVHLPVSCSATAAEASPAVPPVALASPLHILLVEDHELTRTVLARLLSREGHHVAAVDTCKAAREVAMAARQEGDSPFQAIVSDLGLPDGSGLDLIREIKVQFPNIHSIALSGYGTADDIRRSAEAGFIHHLTKPIGMAALRRALAA